MTALDWAIAGFTFLMALWGYRQGLIVGAVSLVAFALGAVAGARLAPLLLEGGSSSPYAPLLAAVGATALGMVGVGLIERPASRVRAALVRGRLAHVADGVGGALLVACLAIGLIWIFGVVALFAPGAAGLRQEVQRSTLLAGINRALPPSGPLIRALHRIDPAPQIASSPGDIAPPGPGIARQVAETDSIDSVVRVLGTACGLGVVGSGWVASPGVIVTNAHVVAGETDTRVETTGGRIVDAEPILFDPRNDLAVLSAAVGLKPLTRSPNPRSGMQGAMLGYPEDGPLRAVPVRLGTTRAVIGQNAYGAGPVKRAMTSFRGLVRHGNSGGPILDREGRVMATVFAATTEGPRGGLAIPNRVVAAELPRAGSPVSTGPCTR